MPSRQWRFSPRAGRADPSKGYATTFLRQLEPLLGQISERGIKVVVNAGGLNPKGLASEIRRVAAELEIASAVSHVEGDDLLERIPAILSAGITLEHLDTGRRLDVDANPPLTANAYIGGWAIAAALHAGADYLLPAMTSFRLV